MNDMVEIYDEPTEVVGASGNTAIFQADNESILQMAEKANKYVQAVNRIMDAALKITNELDWVLIGGKPYLQESGSTKISTLFGISIQLVGKPTVEVDSEGYKTYTYKARFMMKDKFLECEGSRCMREDFFAGKGCTKKPDEIDERDVKMAAYTNCLNNGIKRMIPGLRNIDIETLERSGLDVNKIKGYTFKDGAKGGASKSAEDSGLKCEQCGKGVTQKVASYAQGKFGKVLCMDCQKAVQS